MAPKRLRGGSSRAERFSSPEAEVEFTRLSTRPIIKERGFLPNRHHGLVEVITELQWDGICKAPDPVPVNVIREFYANAKDEQDGKCVVRGRRVDYRPDAIRPILGQPPKRVGDEDWVLKTTKDVDMEAIVLELCVPGTVWKYKLGTREPLIFPSSAMNKFARAWYLFLCANIMPTSHTGDVTADRAIILWGILKGKYIDVGYIVYQNILRFLKSSAQSPMPHASVIAGLCKVSGVTWGEDEDLQSPMASIVDVSIKRMPDWQGGVPHPRGFGYDVGDAGASGQGAGAPPRARRVPRVLDAHFRRLYRRMDAIHASNREYAEDMAAALRDVGIQARWPVYGARTPYPPPDSDSSESED